MLGLLAYRTYVASPPIPERVVDSEDRVLFTGEDVLEGQRLFLRKGLMQYGSIFGHGGYLGPDYTADYLRRAALSVSRAHGGAEGEPNADAVRDFKENRYDPTSRILRFSSRLRIPMPMRSSSPTLD